MSEQGDDGIWARSAREHRPRNTSAPSSSSDVTDEIGPGRADSTRMVELCRVTGVAAANLFTIVELFR